MFSVKFTFIYPIYIFLPFFLLFVCFFDQTDIITVCLKSCVLYLCLFLPENIVITKVSLFLLNSPFVLLSFIQCLFTLLLYISIYNNIYLYIVIYNNIYNYIYSCIYSCTIYIVVCIVVLYI